MPPDRDTQSSLIEVTGESQLGRLVLEVRDLHLLSHKFAMLTVAASVLPCESAVQVRENKQIMWDISAAWSKLRNCETGVLRGCDAGLIAIMNGAFSRENEAVFACFEEKGRTICETLASGAKPDHAELCELVRFVLRELYDAINDVLSAASLVAEIGQMNVAKLALTDDLTGLPNRRALQDFLHRMEDAGWPHDRVAIMQVDLDKFKKINDILGHAAGDVALRHAAKTLAQFTHQNLFAARVGGDEFVIVYFAEHSDEEMARLAEDMVAALSLPFEHEGKEWHVGASVGIATGRRSNGAALNTLMNNADLALYTAKNAGRGECRLFSPHLRTQYEEVEELQAFIRDGLDTGQFEPFFQPQVQGRTGKLVGFESLARWHHPTRGVLTPFHFLHVAQEGQLLDDLDRYLMDQTFAAMRSWLDMGHEVPQISINLTSSRLLEVDLVDTIMFSADKFRVDPSMIGVEILESAMIDTGSQRMISNIQNLSDAGFKVELDDFGTGHASIANLRHFKVDRIKIDRSFVKDVHLYSELAQITSAMIGLAHSLRVDALAEGIETPEERLVLNALGCDHIQGFGVARPMPGADIPAWLEKTQTQTSLPSRRPKAEDRTEQQVAS